MMTYNKLIKYCVKEAIKGLQSNCQSQSNLPAGDTVVASLCSGGGSGRQIPKYCRSTDMVRSKELNFKPTETTKVVRIYSL